MIIRVLVSLTLISSVYAQVRFNGSGQAQFCSTVSGPNPNQKCVLPFKHDGVTYTRCPVDPQDDSKHWCSTRVDRNGVHVPNVRQWGHCGPNCPLERRPKQSLSSQSRRIEDKKRCFTVSGPNPGSPCVFPFRYKNKLYTGCDTDPVDRTKTWCSTKTDKNGNHVTGQNEYGHCGIHCPRQPVDGARISGSGSAPLVNGKCLTVSGPNPGKPCIFPFIYDGKSYSGCPIDPDDSSKRWCSTKVDNKGQHVAKQNEYGHCADNCPKSNPTTSSVGKCSRGKCRSFSACAAQTQNRVTCTQSDGSSGLCCKDINSNRKNAVLVPRQDNLEGEDISSVPQRTINDAVTVGQSFAQNVTRFKTQTGNFRSGTPEFFHTQFSRPRNGVNELSGAALTSAFAAKRLVSNSDSLTFRQIGFSNADVSDTVLSRACLPEPRCNFQSRYRTWDGSCNNQFKPKFGQLKTPVQRVLPNAYFDGVLEPRRDTRGQPLPSARLVSSTMTSPSSSPSRINTVMLMALGQFIDHDLTHVPMKNDNGRPIDCCANTNINKFDDEAASTVCFPIRIPTNDRFFRGKRTCMNFARSESGLDLNCQPGPLQQINQITHWLDASNIYGSDAEEGENLRSHRSGLMKTSRASDGSELLPIDRSRECIGGPSQSCFLAGDERVNEQPNLAVMHTLFVREHNRIARQLAKFNPDWNDNKLFEETRRIVNAEWQHIVYNEWLPIILGPRYMTSFGLFPLTDGFSTNYRNDFDPRITNAFAAAAFRIGHSLIPGLIKAISSAGIQTFNDDLKDNFGNMDLVKRRNMMDMLLKALVTQPSENADDKFVDDITNHLFEQEHNGIGLDLVALNIQRGRDHGIPGYIEYRKICRVGKAESFNDLRSNISPKKIELLQRVYESVEDIDLFVGMSLETPVANSGALVGDTFLCLIGDQFARLKLGDRYFYDLSNQSGSFTLPQLTEIRKTSLARIICDNTANIEEIQPLVLEMPDQDNNPLISCESKLLFLGIPTVDLSHWRE